MVAKIVIPPNVPVNDLYASANMTASNALTTTNVFATSAVANGMMTILGANPTSRTSLLVTGNVIVSNALVAGNVFTNTFVLSDTIRVTAAQGNIFASNALVTTNVYASDQVVSTGSTIASFLLIVGGNASVSNALTTSNVSTSNLVVSGNVVIHNAVSTGFKTLDVVGNAYVSNAVTVSNVFTSNVNVAGTTTITSDRTTGHIALSVAGNVYVSNTLTTTNVYASGNVLASGSVVVTGNAYVSNAVSTTNVFAGNVLATGILNVPALTTSGILTARVDGNVYVSNAISTTNVFTGNVLATGTLTVPALTTSGILTARVGGNVYVSNAITLVNDMFTGNTVATGTVTVTNTAGFASLVSRGNVSVSNAFTAASNVFVGNVFASGNIYVSGDSTVIRSTTLFVSGNVYASNAIVSVNVSANTWSSNLSTSVNVTGNMYAGNNITTQNLFTTNVFSTRTQINNAGLTADPATGAFIVSTVSSSTQAQTYPPAAMTGSTLVIPGGGGTYTASASSEQGTQSAWKAFDGRNGFDGVDNIWKSNGGGYNGAGTGLYTGGILTAGTYAGEWLQLQVPGGIILTGYTITPYLGSVGASPHNPRKWFVFGSTDASTWTLLDSRSGVTSWTPNQGQTYSVSTATAFTYFRIVVNEIQSSGGNLNCVIGELSLSGTMVSPLPIAVKNLPNYVESGVTSTVFPSAAMTSDSTVIGTGTYVSSASSTYDNVTYQAYRAFDKNATTVWHQQGTAAYRATTGQYIGTTATNYSTTVGGVPYYGEWLQIRLPTANVLSSYAITSRASLGAQAPATFYIMGSNDDTTFTLIDTQTSVSWSAGGGETKSFTVSSPYPFTRYRIVIGATGGGANSDYTTIASWDLNCLSTLGFNIGDEYWNGTYLYKMMGTNPAWRSIARPVPLAPVISLPPILATSGGTETTITGFKLHTFTTSGTLTVSGGSGVVEVLVVGGGGSGGSRHQGGGGGGGVVYSRYYPITSGTYTVTVGTGGAANAGTAGPGTSGTISAFGTLLALGGGGGSISVSIPGIFGSGGGLCNANGLGSASITGTPGQGFPGGYGTYTTAGENSYAGGGGGGGGSAGLNANGAASVTAGAGGVGYMSNITGTQTFYAGGGGGTCSVGASLYGYGGLGGGGRGGGSGQTTGIAGTDGLGGGGGGGGFTGGTNYASGKGGNGVVIIRVPTTTAVNFQTSTLLSQYVIPIAQTRPVVDIDQITWSVTGQPAPVYIDAQTKTMCNLVIPAGTYAEGTSTLTISAKNAIGTPTLSLALTFQFSPPSFPGLVCWMDRSSWDATARTWADMSGAGNNGFNTSGTVTVQSNFITGTTATYMLWPALMPQTYTFFHVAKYNNAVLGTNTGRIFYGYPSSQNNWLSGFWGSRSGVAYHYGWLNDVNIHSLAWVMSTDQPYLYRSNGTSRGNIRSGEDAPLASNSPRNLATNVDAYEPSDWAIAEMIVYNRTLSSTEILRVEAYLRAKYPAFSL